MPSPKELVELFVYLQDELLTRLLDFQHFAGMGMTPGVSFVVVSNFSRDGNFNLPRTILGISTSMMSLRIYSADRPCDCTIAVATNTKTPTTPNIINFQLGLCCNAFSLDIGPNFYKLNVGYHGLPMSTVVNSLNLSRLAAMPAEIG